MKVIVKEVGKNPQVKEIEDDLKVYREIVEGHIEVVPLFKDVVIICNEEGKLQGKAPNIKLNHDIVVGNIVVVGTYGEEFRGLTEGELFLAKIQLLCSCSL